MDLIHRAQMTCAPANPRRRRGHTEKYRTLAQGAIALLNPNALAPASVCRPSPLRPRQRTLCICFLALSALPRLTLAQDKFEYAKQAELDSQSNVYVSSDEGKLIKMASAGHCSWVEVAADRLTVGCLVMRGPEAEVFTRSLQLEIFLKGGHKRTIEPGAPIRDWHFWKDGQQVSVYSGPPKGPGTYALYDAATGRLMEKLAEPPDESLLPQWAKTRAQIEVESVPMGPALAQERTKWIAKVLWQIGKIQPGMRRKDLRKVFATEGGLSNRFQRTYVHVECPYIKVDVRFKAANDQRDASKEEPEDIIESISRPYLAWSVMD